MAEARRYNILCCGRRFGKTDLGQILISKPLLAGRPVGWFAPKYKILDDAWQEIKRIYAPLITQRSDTDKKMTLITGGTLEAWTLDGEGAARSRKYARVIIDEAAYVDGLSRKYNSDIAPTLLDLHGDAYFLSTPKGLNDFHRFWMGAADNPDWGRWQMPTYENPYIPVGEIDTMRNALPERVTRQEIMAEFVEDGSYFQNVDKAAVIMQPDQPGDHEGHYIVAGIDWALSNDYTVITLACRDCNRVVDWDRFNQIDFTYQRERLYTICERWNVASVLPERNSIGEPNIEIIQSRLPITNGPDNRPGFQTTATSKPALIQGLAAALEHDGFLVPADYADELRSYEVTLSTSGSPRFSSPDGQHDDRVISLALARFALVNTRVQVFI